MVGWWGGGVVGWWGGGVMRWWGGGVVGWWGGGVVGWWGDEVVGWWGWWGGGVVGWWGDEVMGWWGDERQSGMNMPHPNNVNNMYGFPCGNNSFFVDLTFFFFFFFLIHFIYPGKFTLSYKASSQRLPELVF